MVDFSEQIVIRIIRMNNNHSYLKVNEKWVHVPRLEVIQRIRKTR